MNKKLKAINGVLAHRLKSFCVVLKLQSSGICAMQKWVKGEEKSSNWRIFWLVFCTTQEE
jgi:hypothetical protein